MGEWIAAAPQIEEDVALGNIALDLLGQARALLTYAGQVEGEGRDEDDLAYLRDERDFLNAQIFELRQRRLRRHHGPAAGHLDLPVRALRPPCSQSTDETLAAVAAKAVKEVDYHRDHATQWALRLGDGTDESHRRMQAGLDERLAVRRRAVRDRRPRTPAGRSRHRGRPVDARGAASGVPRATCSPRPRSTVPRRTCGTPVGARHPHRADGLPARRDAAPGPLAPGSDRGERHDDARPVSRAASGESSPRCSTPRCRC